VVGQLCGLVGWFETGRRGGWGGGGEGAVWRSSVGERDYGFSRMLRREVW
jgi:hypothetical protein